MAIKKIRMRPEGVNDYGDVLYPETSVDMIQGIERFAVASGTNTYTASLAHVPALVTGLRVCIKFTNANTSSSTLNINSLGAKTIKKANGNDLSSGNLKEGGIYTFVYDGSNFILQGEGGEYGTAQASDVLSGKTIGTENGIVTGTIPSKSAQTYTPITTDQIITLGQYLSGNQTIKGDANLIASNILRGKSIFGVIGNVINGDGMIQCASGSGYYSGSGGRALITGLGFFPNIIYIHELYGTSYSRSQYFSIRIDTKYVVSNSAISISFDGNSNGSWIGRIWNVSYGQFEAELYNNKDISKRFYWKAFD